MAKVMVAMSGGVDSTMAAALLVEQGHDVTGVHLKMADTPSGLPGKGCCTLDDARDARRVSDKLGIPFYVWDFHEDFTEKVVDDFLDEYSSGRTPNPCIRCNERVKYAALQDRALAAGFDYLATGHHVILRTDANGDVGLFRPVDSNKDQTYVLYMADQQRLRHSLFPCGEYLKQDLRAMAAQRNLVTAVKPDSTDICFIPTGTTAQYLHSQLPSQPGVIVDKEGTELAKHDGAFAFTIGQRKGLGVSGLSQPHFVTNVSGNIVTIGTKQDLEVTNLVATDISWTKQPIVSTHCEQGITAQVRYHGKPLPVTITQQNDSYLVVFTSDKPFGVAPGQAVVFYCGDECLGGGTIT